MHKYLHKYIYTYKHKYTLKHTFVDTNIHKYMHINIHTYTHTNIRIYINTYMHSYLHSFIHAYIHTYLYFIYTSTHIHTCIYIHTSTHINTYLPIFKMADDVKQRVVDALEELVSITEKRGNLRKDLKHDILLSVSVLRKEFSNLKCQLKTEKYEQKKPREEFKNA